MHYKSFADLSADVKANLHKIPKDVTLIVGIPRSGLLAANLLSIFLKLPLTDIDSFLNGKILSPAVGNPSVNENAFNGKILIVDDSVATGKAIVDAKQKLKALIQTNTYNLLFCCVYAEPARKELVDIPLFLLDRPRLFEWNLFHNSILSKGAVELEGVLCKPFDEKNKSDDLAYIDYLNNVQPNFISKSKIALLITARPEKYRAITEAWLQKSGIQYGELQMFDPAKSTDAATFKAYVYKKRKELEIFLEKDAVTAKHIFELTGKDVYCLESNSVFTRLNYKKLTFKIKRKSIYLMQNVKKAVLKAF